MKLKAILTITLFLIFFIGEISTSFSFKSENDRNNAIPNTIPLSYKVTNRLSISTETQSIDINIIDFLQRNRIVGASVAITKEGRLIYSKGFGFAVKETLDSVTPRSLFRIASVSKLITAVAIMKLVEDEKLDINARVFGQEGILNDSVYLQYNDKRYENITIHHLLNHTAGWNGKKTDPVFNSLYVAKIMDVVPPAQIPVIIEYALTKKLDYLPGKNYSYSNLGYCVLGEVIKKVTGMEYEDYVQFAILHPLGIWDMHIGKSFFNEKYPNEVRYYNLEDSPKIWAFDGSQERVPLEYGGNNIELLGPAGGWIASAPELAKLMTAIDGFDSRPDIISKSSIAFMTEDRDHSRSFIGWRGTDGHGTWWRTGTLTGTSALIMRHANGINWIVLLNTTTNRRSHIHNKLSHTMFSALYGIHKWPGFDLFNYEPQTVSRQQFSSSNN
jgi:CubicO group peptidase (beta-lactamase class C family)